MRSPGWSARSPAIPPCGSACSRSRSAPTAIARRRPAESYAGRFAAREATIKALGGYRGKRWQDIHVSRHPSGAPSIVLEGNAKRRADMLGITKVLITFTHEKTNAVAFAVAVGE